MKEITLTPKKLGETVPSIEAEVISPAFLQGKSLKEIEELKVYEGKKELKLSELFSISGSNFDKAKEEEIRITINGDASKIKRIGSKMKAGEIVIKGSCGMRAGHGMEGGKIVIEGNADSFTGLEMAGGEIVIKGNAGSYLGAAYRGNWRGMLGGKITVEGNAGSEIGSFMKGGEIIIKGNAGDFAGVHMSGGEIKILGKAGARAGAEMTGGKITMNSAEKMLPSFKFEGIENGYKKYSGDHAERNAKGILLVKEITEEKK